MKKIAIVFLMLIIASGPAAAEEISPAAQQLSARAAARRTEAETALQELRIRLLNERTARIAKIQAAYAALHDADAAAAAARKELATLQRSRDEFLRDQSFYRRKFSLLWNELAVVAGACNSSLPAKNKDILPHLADLPNSNKSADSNNSSAASPKADTSPFNPGSSKLSKDISLLAAKAEQGLLARVAALRQRQLIRMTQGTVAGRDGKICEVPVMLVGGIAAYACGADAVTCGALSALPASHSAVNTTTATSTGCKWRLTGRVFSSTEQAALRRAAAIIQQRSAETVNPSSLDLSLSLPMDPTSVLFTRNVPPPPTWKEWLHGGGIFIYPIFLCGILGLCLIGERICYLLRTHLPAAAFAKLCAVQKAGSETLCSAAKYPEMRLLAAGQVGHDVSAAERDSLMEAALLAEEPRLNRSLPLLAALAGVAPLLGLLGTVSGMIHTFADIASFGTGNTKILSGGISEALITTELGLIIAVPLLLAHAWLAHSIERRKMLLEQRAMTILQSAASEFPPTSVPEMPNDNHK